MFEGKLTSLTCKFEVETLHLLTTIRRMWCVNLRQTLRL